MQFIKNPSKASPFKNSNGVRYTKGLFFETTPDNSTAIYTLKNEDHLVYLSLYKLYMALEDPTEYLFAQEYLDGWEHWQAITRTNWFKPYVSRWRQELELKIKAIALRNIKAESRSSSKNALSANRYLLEKGWIDKSPRGRPSNEDISRRELEIIEDRSVLNEDFNRIFNKQVVN
jgi:hypothetical protein